MADDVALPYGAGTVQVVLPEGGEVRRLGIAVPAAIASGRDLVRRALAEPVDSAPLAELARGVGSAAILIPGKTRVAGTADYVPEIVAGLNEAGIDDERIEVILATGTHEAHLERDFPLLLGEEMVRRVRCVPHDCHDRDRLVDLGRTTFGTPVLVHRRVLDAGIVILTGRILPHYFAGFSGGRKALIPGVAGWDTIVANHRLTLGEGSGIDSRVGPGMLDGNPVHLDMLEGAARVGAGFCVNTILDAQHRLADVVAGDPVHAHLRGCARVREWNRVGLEAPVDLLITSAGGDPYDCNFMQALKAVFNMRSLVRPGGTILWVARCVAGMHPGFRRWAAIGCDAELEAAVRADYDLTGHNSLMLRALLRHARVALWSDLPREQVRELGLEPIGSSREASAWIGDRARTGPSCAVVPRANVAYGVVREGSCASKPREGAS